MFILLKKSFQRFSVLKKSEKKANGRLTFSNVIFFKKKLDSFGFYLQYTEIKFEKKLKRTRFWIFSCVENHSRKIEPESEDYCLIYGSHWLELYKSQARGNPAANTKDYNLFHVYEKCQWAQPLRLFPERFEKLFLPHPKQTGPRRYAVFRCHY